MTDLTLDQLKREPFQSVCYGFTLEWVDDGAILVLTLTEATQEVSTAFMVTVIPVIQAFNDAKVPFTLLLDWTAISLTPPLRHVINELYRVIWDYDLTGIAAMATAQNIFGYILGRYVRGLVGKYNPYLKFTCVQSREEGLKWLRDARAPQKES